MGLKGCDVSAAWIVETHLEALSSVFRPEEAQLVGLGCSSIGVGKMGCALDFGEHQN